jgi:uncharacterized membrane protein YgcG
MGVVLMKKITAFIFALMLALSALAITSTASKSNIYDPMDHLTDAEEARIASSFAEAEDRCGVSFALLVNDGYATYNEDNIFYSFGLSRQDDAAILLVEYYGGDWYYELFLYGEADEKISYSQSDGILDSSRVYNNIKSGRIADGAIAFASLTADELVSSGRGALAGVIIVSVVLAMVAAAVSIIIVTVRYKTKLKSPIYPISDFAKMDLTHSRDDFRGSFVTKTRINTSSGGSRSGGGFGGGSRGRR